jgi:branched-chain amino acid aminotransferase
MTLSRTGAREPAARRAAVSDALPAFWVNGERRPPTGFHVSARDRGLTLADGVFETMLAPRGTVFRLDRHLARLTSALDTLAIPCRPELRDWVLEAAGAAGGADVSVRLTVTRGIGATSVRPPPDADPTVIIGVDLLPIFPAAVYDVGLTAHVASGRRNERAITAGLKTLAYTDAVAALLEAERTGADEALFLDTEGHCSEATSSNLFAVSGGVLVTPPVSCGALPGITRAVVLELASALRVPAAERVFGLDELVGADEAFLTSSLRGLAPLVRVGPHAIGPGTPGLLTRRLADGYVALVARECSL